MCPTASLKQVHNLRPPALALLGHDLINYSPSSMQDSEFDPGDRNYTSAKLLYSTCRNSFQAGPCPLTWSHSKLESEQDSELGLVLFLYMLFSELMPKSSDTDFPKK